jgi:hypothetical protein
MGDQQYELGTGRVWSFEASANTTSGVLVYLAGGDSKVRVTTAVSQQVMGISLVPASAGRQISVLMEGIANALITGANVVAGDLLGPGAGNGYLRERAHSQLNEARYDAAVALEDIATGTRGKVKLYW